MDSDRWERVQALFHAAADLRAPEQVAYLRRECGDDQDLVREVSALLAGDSTETLLDRNLGQLAHDVLAPGIPVALRHQLFGPYRITGVLGEGGMGVVYLARRDDLGSAAAIKILRDALLSPSRRDRFASEQRTLAHLNHPGIARLYDANTLPDGTPWFVMEYVEGQPLTDYCASHRSTINERLQLFRAICEAVQYAHLHLVIHRDLKPSNLFVKPDGSIKLLDFGIAKQLDNVDDPVDQTRTGLRFMTPAYASPEQIRGERMGIHSDIYSLGVVLYELLVGRLPFDLSNRTPGEAATIIAEREPEKPSVAARRMAYLPGSDLRTVSASKAAWADLDMLCLTAMHKAPERRYRTVEALIRDVDHYLSGEPLEARPDRWSYRVGKFTRRNWEAVTAALVVLIVVIGLVAFYTVRLARARNVAVAEAARTQRIQSFMLRLFAGGDEEAGPSDSLRVVDLLDRGVQEARALDAEPLVQAELYQTLGGIYQLQGNLDRSDSLLRASLDQRRRLLGGDNADVAANLVALGGLRLEQASYEEAETLIRQGLAMTKVHLAADHPAIAAATAALGEVLVNRGEYAKAIPILEEAVRLEAAKGDTTPDLSNAVTLLANAHYYQGEYAISDSINQDVLRIDRHLYGAHHPSVGADLLNLGAIQMDWGHYADAERYYREALESMRAWFGDDHPETASALTSLSRAIVSQGRPDEAVGMLQRALAIQERVYGPVHPRVASALNELGRVAQQQGRLDQAEADYSRMVRIYQQIYRDNHYLIGVALSNLAGVYVDRKQYTKAELMFRDVIQRYSKTLDPDHQLMGIARVRLGRTLLLDRRYPEAATESLAGYDILHKQGEPPATWMERARRDLVAEYDSLGQPEQSSRFRAELADSSAARR
ncbi:MAG: serine/threonine-protein kinase [Gemmatimonadota bacterium]